MFWQSIEHLTGLERLAVIARRSTNYTSTQAARRVIVKRLRRMGIVELRGIVPLEWGTDHE